MLLHFKDTVRNNTKLGKLIAIYSVLKLKLTQYIVVKIYINRVIGLVSSLLGLVLSQIFIKCKARREHFLHGCRLGAQQDTKYGSVANIYKGQAALICGRNYPANAINCL